ncbi:MAG: DNA methyltransferase [Patescibacteria group bacterium]|nr:DNA methyltransferase [Patescibacteria group bacterium]
MKKVKTGEIFRLGNNRLACGDVNDKELLKRLIGEDKITAIISDVPYGVGYVESKSGFKQKLGCEKIIANDQAQSDEEYRDFTIQWLENIKPYLARKNAVYIFNSDKMIFALREAMLQAKYKFTQLLIWVKSQAVIGRLDYLPQHELIAYGWYGAHDFRHSQDKSVLFYPKPNKSKLHSTMKPVGLLRRLILNSTKINDFVFDGFAGSGSLLIGCEQTKRKCLLVEIDEGHCSTIIARWEKIAGLKSEKI